jgi:hypothetical protein
MQRHEQWKSPAQCCLRALPCMSLIHTSCPALFRLQHTHASCSLLFWRHRGMGQAWPIAAWQQWCRAACSSCCGGCRRRCPAARGGPLPRLHPAQSYKMDASRHSGEHALFVATLLHRVCVFVYGAVQALRVLLGVRGRGSPGAPRAGACEFSSVCGCAPCCRCTPGVYPRVSVWFYTFGSRRQLGGAHFVPRSVQWPRFGQRVSVGVMTTNGVAAWQLAS